MGEHEGVRELLRGPREMLLQDGRRGEHRAAVQHEAARQVRTIYDMTQ